MLHVAVALPPAHLQKLSGKAENRVRGRNAKLAAIPRKIAKNNYRPSMRLDDFRFGNMQSQDRESGLPGSGNRKKDCQLPSAPVSYCCGPRATFGASPFDTMDATQTRHQNAEVLGRIVALVSYALDWPGKKGLSAADYTQVSVRPRSHMPQLMQRFELALRDRRLSRATRPGGTEPFFGCLSPRAWTALQRKSSTGWPGKASIAYHMFA